MENTPQNLSNLYVPINVRRRKEYVDGFGKPELIITCIWGLIGGAVGLFLFLLNQNDPIYLVVSLIIFPAATFMFVKKDKTNRSTVDHLKAYYLFSRSKKRFDYKYHNIYEKEVGKKS